MMSAQLPAALVCASLGLALSYADPKVRIMAILSLIVSASASWVFTPFLNGAGSASLMACWAGIVIAAGAVIMGRNISLLPGLVLSTGTGASVGVVVASAGQPNDLLTSLPLVVLMLPGSWLIFRNHEVVLKVIGSWLTVIAILSAALLLTPTAGYEPDHLE